MNANALIGKPVEIDWRDPEITGGWASAKTLKPKLVSIKSYGILVSIDKGVVIIAGTVAKGGQFADITKFPEGCVVDIREVSRNE